MGDKSPPEFQDVLQQLVAPDLTADRSLFHIWGWVRSLGASILLSPWR